MPKTYLRLRLILGDQLNAPHSWYQEKDDDTLYVIAELHEEATYVVHHVQKICAFFAAMEAFAGALQQAGHQVLHLNLDESRQHENLSALLAALIEQHRIRRFEYQLPDEYRLRQALASFAEQTGVPAQAVSTEHFYLGDEELDAYFSPDKRHRMEAFYRKMRVRFQLLMDGDDPEGGQWNFDADNRNKLKKADLAEVPDPLLFDNDVSEIVERIKRHDIPTMGHEQYYLPWPVTRRQSVQMLEHFCLNGLKYFGRFQDAMTGKMPDADRAKQWSLFHSRLSFAMNSKMLSPQAVVNRVIQHYRNHPEEISLPQVEGFIRQIVGWREFVRGIYWTNMPRYATLNALSASRPLPSWFWNGKTRMNCLKHAITQSLDFAYAHHIQRLMLTGNFCLLAGIDPNDVDAWYMGIYIDAIEFVELPNTRGMSQFADGGIVGSKAYAASGNYVKKMSDYCSECDYKVAQTTEEKACPLNALYWRFMQQHQADFSSNPRNKMVYANWSKKSRQQQQAIIAKADDCLENIENI